MDEDKKNEAIKRVRDYVSQHDDFSIFYHMDGDGVVSCALLNKVLSSMGKNIVHYRATNYEDFDRLDLSEYTKNIIICDINVSEKNLEAFRNHSTCVIDHHELISGDGIVYLNPKMWGDDTYTPCSLVVYRIFSDLLGGYEWIAAVGIASDSGGKSNKDFMEFAAEKSGIKLGSDEYAHDNDFGKCADMVGSLINIYNRDGSDEALGILISGKDLNETIKNERLLAAEKHVRKELDELFKRFEDEKEVHGKVIFFKLDPKKKRYSSTLVTTLSFKPEYSNSIILFMTRINSRLIRINARASNVEGVSLPAAFREVFKTIKGTGGGHDKAAGASIEAKDEETFKKLILDALDNQLKVRGPG